MRELSDGERDLQAEADAEARATLRDVTEERRKARAVKREAQRYNGWKNYQTWNVALWIGNEEPLYRAARDFTRSYKGRRPYAAFIRAEGMENDRTPDRVKWLGSRLCYVELNRMMREL